MADVFISYAREDRPQAERIAQGLTAMGLEAWWDSEIPPGQTWADYTESKLSQCKAVIVLWSQNSTKSQWVREEARIARDKSKLIPAMIDGSQAPFGFGEVQAADLTQWNGDYNHPQWARFSQAVHSAARGPGASPPPPVAPQPVAGGGGWQQTPPPPPPGGGWQQNTQQQQSGGWAGGTPQAGAVEQLSPIGYIQKCFRLFIDGKGRARRAEYWWWALFVVVVSLVAGVIEIALFGMNSYTGQANNTILSTIVGLAFLAPGVSVASRRFHDVGFSGWLVAGFFAAFFVGGLLTGMQNQLGLVITAIAGIGMLVIAVMPSKPGPNQYGPNPKGE